MVMKPQSAKAKGRKLQQWVADKVKILFGLGDRDVKSTSMGVSGADVQLSELAFLNFPYEVECKSYAKIAVYKWWEQAIARQDQGEPLLIIKQNRSNPLVIMSWDHFEKLLTKNKEKHPQ